jgi:hypothetical protein
VDAFSTNILSLTGQYEGRMQYAPTVGCKKLAFRNKISSRLCAFAPSRSVFFALAHFYYTKREGAKAQRREDFIYTPSLYIHNN